MKKKGLLKDALILFTITLVAAVALSCVYALTKEPIEKAAEETKQEAYEKVFDDVSFENIDKAEDLLSDANEAFASGEAKDGDWSLKKASVSEILRAVDKNGAPCGYVLSVTSKSGYGGDIVAAVGVTNEGEICGLTVISHSETAGFGAQCDDADYQKTFVGDKSAADVDMISGATYTSNALKEICGAALYTVREAESGVSADA